MRFLPLIFASCILSSTAVFGGEVYTVIPFQACLGDGVFALYSPHFVLALHDPNLATSVAKQTLRVVNSVAVLDAPKQPHKELMEDGRSQILLETTGAGELVLSRDGHVLLRVTKSGRELTAPDWNLQADLTKQSPCLKVWKGKHTLSDGSKIHWESDVGARVRQLVSFATKE